MRPPHSGDRARDQVKKGLTQSKLRARPLNGFRATYRGLKDIFALELLDVI